MGLSVAVCVFVWNSLTDLSFALPCENRNKTKFGLRASIVCVCLFDDAINH